MKDSPPARWTNITPYIIISIWYSYGSEIQWRNYMLQIKQFFYSFTQNTWKWHGYFILCVHTLTHTHTHTCICTLAKELRNVPHHCNNCQAQFVLIRQEESLNFQGDLVAVDRAALVFLWLSEKPSLPVACFLYLNHFQLIIWREGIEKDRQKQTQINKVFVYGCSHSFSVLYNIQLSWEK